MAGIGESIRKRGRDQPMDGSPRHPITAFHWIATLADREWPPRTSRAEPFAQQVARDGFRMTNFVLTSARRARLLDPWGNC